jgi:hypothetical protein
LFLFLGLGGFILTGAFEYPEKQGIISALGRFSEEIAGVLPVR